MESKKISTNLIVEGYSPRRDFSGKEGLKKSIEREGLLEPLLVRRDREKYIVIEGVMRFRVVKDLDWKEVDCVIIDADEEKSYHLAYIKNTERNNLNPIEVSLHIKEMREKFGYSVQDLVNLGYAKDDQTIYNKLNLLKLPQDVQEKIVENKITPTVGYKIGAVKDSDLQSKVIDTVCGMKKRSVRKTQRIIENLIDSVNRKDEKPDQKVNIPDGDIPGVYFHDSSEMHEFEDGTIPLITTSPNYGVGLEYEEGVSFEDHLKDLEKSVPVWGRKLCSGGYLCINFGDIHNFGTKNGTEPEIRVMGHVFQKLLEPEKVRLRDIKIWDKGMTFVNNRQVSFNEETKHTSYRSLHNFEFIYIFKKDGERGVPYDLTLKSKISEKEWKESVSGIWRIDPVKKQKGHPAQFPEEIPRRLIKMYSFEDDLVVDTALGSGTTMKVARELGRRGCGYERDTRYKSVIMEKLGIKEEDLKKPEVDEDRGPHGGTPPFIDEFEGIISDILADNDKTPKDVVSARFPYKSDLSKDEIEIDWVTDDEEPDPSGPTASPQLLKSDDYDSQDGGQIGSEESSTLPIETIKNNSRFMNRIVCGDCFNLIKQIENKSIDLGLTSPPYADTKNYGKGIKIFHPDDYVDWILPLLDEIARILKPSGSFILNINDRIVNQQRHTYVHELIVRAVKETPLKLYDVYFWKKPTALPNGNSRRLNNVTEYLIHFCKDQNQVKWNMDAVREPYDENTVKRCQYPVGGFQLAVDKEGKAMGRTRKMIQLNGKGKIPSNVFHFPTASAVRGKKHPAAFHIDLPSWFIKALTNEGDVVTDVFSGSGSTCLAAKKLNRKYIGIEMNEKYHEIAEERVGNATLAKAA